MNLNEFLKREPTKKTFALIGKPLKHSVSVELHSIVYKSEKIEAEYIAVELEESELATFVQAAKSKLSGFNITVPYKQAIIPFLDEVDSTARIVGAVNTVKIETEKLTGFNTDIVGVSETFRNKEIDLQNKNAVLLGTGGTALTVSCALAPFCKSITVVGRNTHKTKLFIESLNIVEKSKFKVADYITLDLSEADILINATPAGMTGCEAMVPLNLKGTKRLSFVFDTLYTPLQTALLKNAAGRHIKHENGLHMLITQGIKADELWFDRKVDASTIKLVRSRLAGNVAVNRLDVVHHRKNVLLSGFMGCGKTTIGRVLAKRLGFEFYDVDRAIEEDTKLSVKQIFDTYGEAHFRQLEREYLQTAVSGQGLVIASGGGAMVSDQNYEIAASGALIIYLKADFEFIFQNISKSKNRPLLLTENPRETAFNLYQARMPFYEKNCDLSVRADLEINRVVRNIIYSI